MLKIYKDQWVVEQRHRDLKQTLKVRPVFLHNDDRIHALIAVIGIALLIFGYSNLNERAIAAGITRLARAVSSLRDGMPTGTTPST